MCFSAINMKFQGLLIILPLLQTVLDQVMVNCTVVVDFKDMSKTGYLEIFDTGGNVLLIKLFAEVKHVGGEQGLAVCPSEGKTEVNETQVRSKKNTINHDLRQCS